VHGAVISGNFSPIREYSSTIKNQRKKNCVKGIKYIWKETGIISSHNKKIQGQNKLTFSDRVFFQGWNEPGTSGMKHMGRKNIGV
jgi:hypothetical protein